MITEDYVSFEVAKLLKEKGFEILTGKVYDNQNKLDYQNVVCWQEKRLPYISAPTHQMAMKWLREKGIYFSLVPFIENVGWPKDTWHINFYNSDGIIGGGFPVKGYENAVEAALKYAFENLI